MPEPSSIPVRSTGAIGLDGNDGTALTFRNLLVLGAETKTIDDYGRLGGHPDREGGGPSHPGWSVCTHYLVPGEGGYALHLHLCRRISRYVGSGKTYVAVVPPEKCPGFGITIETCRLLQSSIQSGALQQPVFSEFQVDALGDLPGSGYRQPSSCASSVMAAISPVPRSRRI